VKSFKAQYLLLGAALIFGPAAASAQDTQKTIKTVPVQPTRTIDGQTMFHEYCAVCHGDNGKGNGPAADALKKAPADLTQVARKNGGTFPEVKVQRTIAGADEIGAHGNRDMPVWGNIFRSMGNQDGETLRVSALMKYVESLQAK
jgi:mono/diheme cytochrome c family protein